MVTPPVEVHDDRVRLAVVDEGFAPRPIGFRAPSSTDEGGWGLRLVDGLSDNWVHSARRGRTSV